MLLLLLKRSLPWPHSTTVDFNEEQYEVARYVFLKVCMYLYVSMYVCICVHILQCMNVYVYVCVHACVHVCVHGCVRVPVCVCLYIDVSFVNLPTLTSADSIFSCTMYSWLFTWSAIFIFTLPWAVFSWVYCSQHSVSVQTFNLISICN